MATNFRVKIGKSGLLTLYIALAFRNELEYRPYDFRRLMDIIWLHYMFSNSGVYEGKGCTPRRFFLKITLSDKLSQDLPDRLLPNFHHVVGV